MSATCLALLLPLAPAVQDWTPLELPELCAERAPGPWQPPLVDGAHVLLERFEGPRRPEARAELSASQLAQVLENEARRQGRQLLVYSGAPPLLVQGAQADTEWAREQLAGIDRAARALEVELDVLLAPARADGDELEPAEAAWRHRAQVRSGDTASFGERVHHPFVSTFDVEVSSDSGVAAPVIGSAFTGATVHLRVARVDGGRRVHVVGLLDLAEAREWGEFDPDTIDLGMVQEPVVASVQVAFSGVVASGEALEVELRGAPLEQPDWTVVVRASTFPDEESESAEGWRLVDLALLAEAPRQLPAFELGTGLDAQAWLEGLAGAASPITPSALFLRSESLRRGATRGAPGNGVPTERTLLLPAAEAEAAAALSQLVRALESGRTGTRRVELTSGPMQVRFPVATGEVARVSAGTERTWLVDYDTQIAPDTWMPAPRVERAFDGLVWQARAEGATLHGAWAETRTAGVEVRSKEQASMGVLQLPARSAQLQRGRRAGADQEQVLLEEGEGWAGLRMRFPAE
jgi:hypothetical protein